MSDDFIENNLSTKDVAEYDGVLGMDFLSKQPVYFDPIRNCAYFGSYTDR